MKELLKAKEIYEQIIKLDKDIISLEKNLDSLIEHESDGTIKVSFNTSKKEEIKMDEDGSLEPGQVFRGFTFLMDYSRNTEEKSKFNNEIKLSLNANELIITMASLLNYKQELRKNLIKEFNNLSIKLKI